MNYTARSIVVTGISIVGVLIVIVFGISRFNRYLAGPSIAEISISDYMTVDTSPLIISGNLNNTAEIIINGTIVPINDQSYFEQRVVLPVGHSIIEIVVIDNFNKEKNYSYNIMNTRDIIDYPTTLYQAMELLEAPSITSELLAS